ncbi:MAG TPA: hypothetical protein VFW42_11945 [Fluviicoccus sp.]|nr:hypothetical protein [Fluviicoccus sp.]
MDHPVAATCPHCLSRRRFLGSGFALGLGLLLPAVSEAAGRFHEFGGIVRVDGRKASAATRIHAGARIETGVAPASFVLGDNAFLIRPGSSVQLARQSKHSPALSGFRLITGAILGVFGPGPKKLVTNTATIGIRGTGVYFENRPESSYVCLCYGAIDLNANVRPEAMQPVSASHHEGRLIGGDGVIGPGGMVNHTDEELVLLESLVGRKPPFLNA